MEHLYFEIIFQKIFERFWKKYNRKKTKITWEQTELNSKAICSGKRKSKSVKGAKSE